MAHGGSAFTENGAPAAGKQERNEGPGSGENDGAIQLNVVPCPSTSSHMLLHTQILECTYLGGDVGVAHTHKEIRIGRL